MRRKIWAGAEILRRASGGWNSMNDESHIEMHFSLDFLLEEPYI
jgi:hypothetical protein